MAAPDMHNLSAATTRPTHLEPSELGTKQYWENAYTREIDNNTADPSDEGTIWFDDSGAEDKMLQFLEDDLFADQDEPAMEREDLWVLDVGTGNGHLLFAMQDAGWRAHLVGVDYSQRSVLLAQQIYTSRKAFQSQREGQMEFAEWDLLHGERLDHWPQGGFDVVLDKGTFDAISLGDDIVDEHGHRGCELYPLKIKNLVAPGGFLLITSCNWTEDELRRWFEGDSFAHYATLKYPSFTFGGQTGQTVSSVCFRRK